MSVSSAHLPAAPTSFWRPSKSSIGAGGPSPRPAVRAIPRASRSSWRTWPLRPNGSR
jgi:hypothetical protein